MGKSSPRKKQPQPAVPTPPPAPYGGRLYVFTPLKLFVVGLILLGVGFTAGVLLQTALMPSPSFQTAASSAPTNLPVPSPGNQSQVQLPSFEQLQAIEQMREHLTHDPDDLETRLRLAHALFDTGNYREAVTHYEAVLESRPEDADVRTDLGVAYRRSGRSEMAAQAFRRAIQSQPLHRNAHYNLGIVLANDLGDPAGAVEVWERFLKLAPDAPNAATIRQAIQDMKKRF